MPLKIVGPVLVLVVAIVVFAWIGGADEPAPAGQIDRQPEPRPASTVPPPAPVSQGVSGGSGTQHRPVPSGTPSVAPEASAPRPGAVGSGPRPDLPVPGSPGSPEPVLGVTSTGRVLTSPEDSGGASLMRGSDAEGRFDALSTPEIGPPNGDTDDVGLAPEFGEFDLDYGAPEDGVPQIEGPPPEASHPRDLGPAPEESVAPDEG